MICGVFGVHCKTAFMAASACACVRVWLKVIPSPELMSRRCSPRVLLSSHHSSWHSDYCFPPTSIVNSLVISLHLVWRYNMLFKKKYNKKQKPVSTQGRRACRMFLDLSKRSLETKMTKSENKLRGEKKDKSIRKNELQITKTENCSKLTGQTQQWTQHND